MQPNSSLPNGTLKGRQRALTSGPRSSIRRQSVIAAVIALATLLLPALHGSASTATRPSAGMFGATISTAPSGATVSGPWLVWNPHTCSFQQTPHHPSTFTFALKRATRPVTFAYAEYSASQAATFIVANNKSIDQAARTAGITIKLYNNNYPSQTDPIAVAQEMTAIHPAGVFEANAVAALYPAIFSRLKAACIPTLVMYLTEAGYPMFGTSWPTAGTVAGTYAAGQITKRHWKPSTVAVFICADRAVGPSVEAAEFTFQAALKQHAPAVPSKRFYREECGPTQASAGAPVSAWMNSHPGIQHLIAFALNDEIALGASNALARAGRAIDRDTLVIGTGADQLGVQEIYGGHETASVTFFPERYGTYMVPLMEAILDGKAVPSSSGPPAIAVDASNVGRFYPRS